MTACADLTPYIIARLHVANETLDPAPACSRSGPASVRNASRDGRDQHCEQKGETS